MKDGEALVFSLVRAGRGHHLPGFCPQKLQGDDSSPRAAEGKVFCPCMLRLPPAADSTLRKPPPPPVLSTRAEHGRGCMGPGTQNFTRTCLPLLRLPGCFPQSQVPPCPLVEGLTGIREPQVVR